MPQTSGESANEIDVEYLSDKSGEYRAVKKDTDFYLTNTECVILNKFFTSNPQTYTTNCIILTKNAEALTYSSLIK